MQITKDQIRAARGLLNMSMPDLAVATGISLATLNKFEAGQTHQLQDATAHKLRTFFEQRVVFTEFEGVRKRADDIEVFVGKARFDEFAEFMYRNLEEHGGDVCVSAADETQFAKYRNDPEIHRARMRKLIEEGRITVRIMAAKSEWKKNYDVKFRMLPELQQAPTAFYVFGKCLALISFDHPEPPYVILIKSGPFADAYRQSFNMAWATAKAPIRGSEADA